MAAKFKRDVQASDVIWWLAEFVFTEHRAPSAQQVQNRWGVSRTTAYRYASQARERLEIMHAREGGRHAPP